MPITSGQPAELPSLFLTEPEGDVRYVERVPPSMTLYEGQAEVFKQVLYQHGDDIYAALQSSPYTIYKSTDRGGSWTAKGNPAGAVSALTRSEVTDTLILCTTAPVIQRSTDDGANWITEHTPSYPPLGAQGLITTPSGYVLVGEYGNDANTVYNVLRSTDDGVTFSSVLASPGTDAGSDPGHIHSIVYDTFAEKFLTFMDRPSPEVYQSSDEGATWAQVGTASDVSTEPNFVALMVFADYLAWGYDNSENGIIARIPRESFYSGEWDDYEVVYTGNRNVFYHTFPTRADEWLICAATETVGAETDIGTWSSDTLIVYDNGAKVAGGFRHISPGSEQQVEGGHKVRFCGYNAATYDQDGDTWVNLPAGSAPSTFTAIPISVGLAPQMPRTFAGLTSHLVLPNNTAFRARMADDSGQASIILMDANNRVRVLNSASSPIPELRFYESTNNLLSVLFDDVTTWAFKSTGAFGYGNPVYMGSSTTAPSIQTGTGTPEGAVTARIGSMFMRSDGGANTSLYVKESGTGNTGWVAK